MHKKTDQPAKNSCAIFCLLSETLGEKGLCYSVGKNHQEK
jgi:hypothetical protein